MSDRIFGAIGVLLAIAFALSALAIQESFLSDAVGPKAFPLIIAAVLAISSAFIALKPDASPKWPSLNRFVEIIAAAVSMILYAELLPVLGFIIATIFGAAYLTWRLGSSALESLIIGVGTSLGIYVIFHLVLGLALARGPLGF
ncbi:Tripartite tricarboxylate transporter TctB family protein [Aquimixticola soesokkakensis]|uniref:Tripartite tricarboxylate transporter TctB family protein n=1 Tax=Aquimixticola soesokkakensis TaxID=1519096 RepID=A0A1Y5SX66_9RHOB|nr:tripartite tricarboxylate transporter TctB family protein [Aquimixticola soesokkakensis]SLN50498.1 Tripartite tricarboxylate transporter TctB family protein [Aquimixticola soesokkakensis]